MINFNMHRMTVETYIWIESNGTYRGLYVCAYLINLLCLF